MYNTPKVIVTYQGQRLSATYFKEHPEIHHLYPSKEVFQNSIYLPVLNRGYATNTDQTIEISENGVKVNGVPHTY